jgi:hypothetical protein
MRSQVHKPCEFQIHKHCEYAAMRTAMRGDAIATVAVNHYNRAMSRATVLAAIATEQRRASTAAAATSTVQATTST